MGKLSEALLKVLGLPKPVAAEIEVMDKALKTGDETGLEAIVNKAEAIEAAEAAKKAQAEESRRHDAIKEARTHIWRDGKPLGPATQFRHWRLMSDGTFAERLYAFAQAKEIAASYSPHRLPQIEAEQRAFEAFFAPVSKDPAPVRIGAV